MNSRIQELKNQCWVEKHWDKENERWIDRHIDLDKFAELIVGECVYVSEGYFGFKDHTPGTAIANEIKQHFGVEG